ncbi:hypothetical protein [Olsenella sp. Marseille-P4559]|uniref:hypothetical protein n=1 Tax=Olsenella sp. Marseille-P4559 TaxID=2364795 RepID=UPI00352C61E5
MHLDDESFIERDSIVFPSPKEIVELLGLKGRVPCVRQEKITTLASGRVAEHSVSHKRWDYFQIEFGTQNGLDTQGLDARACKA